MPLLPFRVFTTPPFQELPPPERDVRLLALDLSEELLSLKRAVARAHGLDPAAPTHKVVTALYAFAAKRGEE